MDKKECNHNEHKLTVLTWRPLVLPISTNGTYIEVMCKGCGTHFVGTVSPK